MKKRRRAAAVQDAKAPGGTMQSPLDFSPSCSSCRRERAEIGQNRIFRTFPKMMRHFPFPEHRFPFLKRHLSFPERPFSKVTPATKLLTTTGFRHSGKSCAAIQFMLNSSKGGAFRLNENGECAVS
jgi:hypothetical protein